MSDLKITNYDFDDTASYKDIFLKLLSACIRLKMQAVTQDENVIEERVNKCINWITKTDFFETPASTKYHDSEPHGLLNHTIHVVKQVYDLIVIPKFQSVELLSAVTCALVHDWCKIGLYKPYYKNVKDEKTGQWTKELAYQYDKANIPLGHGVASYYIASKFIPLNLQETEAIRWHMGAYQVVPQEISEFLDCNADNPLNHLIQFADQLACANY